MTYLSAAASNAAVVENMALQAGLKKGGAAKGELVLAIFELANCFRHGWGIPKDPIAAKQVGRSSLSSRCICEEETWNWVSSRAWTVSVACLLVWLTRDLDQGRRWMMSHAMTDGLILQYYETAANLGDTGESTPGLMMPKGQSS